MKMGGGCLTIWKYWKIFDLGVVKNLKKEYRVRSKKRPDSPPPQKGASDPISELSGLCSYLFYPNLFPSQVSEIFTKKQPECPLLHSASAVNCFLYPA